MKTIKVSLNSIDKVKVFVSGRYVIDAKSIMGIFSLDLSKPIELMIHDDSVIEEVESVLQDFILE